MSSYGALRGKRIFFAEDEVLIAMSLEDMLLDLGCVIAGSALTHAEALSLAEGVEADAAILDLNLGSLTSLDVADVFARRAVPVLFATGYGSGGTLGAFRSDRILQKPYAPDQLARVLVDIFRAN